MVGKVLLAGLALALASGALARIVSSAVIAGLPPTLEMMYRWGPATGRLTEAMDALPTVAKGPGPTAVFLGSSLTQEGFSPAVFDETLREQGATVTSFNYGMNGVSPLVLRHFAERIASEHRAAGSTLDLAVLELTPSTATAKRAQSSRHRDLSNLKLGLLITPAGLLERAWDSPSSAVELLGVKLMGGSTPKATSFLLRMQLFHGPPPSWWPNVPAEQDDSGTYAAAERVFLKLKAQHGGAFPGWDSRTRGEERWWTPDTDAEYRAFLARATRPEELERGLQDSIGESDVVDLHFDDAALADYAAAARALRSVSRRTVVVVFPRNLSWVKSPPEAMARLAGALEDIARKEGVEVLDLSRSPEFGAEDFMDLEHLNELTGRPRLSELLARRLGPDLAPAHVAGALGAGGGALNPDPSVTAQETK